MRPSPLPAILSQAASWCFRRLTQDWGLFVLLGLALAHRVAFFRWWKAFPGGDTYNFILIAQELLRGSYPVAEKRLPVYPALIALGQTILDWEQAAIVVAVVASLVSMVLLYALGRTIGLPTTALVIGLAPFQAVAPFLFQSVRGYADTTFLALFLGAVLAFLRTRTRRGAIGTGTLFALASLTRFEGIFLLALFPVLALLFWKPRTLLRPALAAVLVCWLPFALLFTRVGRPLLPVEYFADAEQTVFGVTTAREFVKNYVGIWTGVGADRLWSEPQRLLRDAARVPFSAWPSRLRSVFTDPKEFPSLLLLVGVMLFFRRRARILLPILLPFLVMAIPVAWWGVRQRFLLAFYPLVFLLLAFGAYALVRAIRQLTARWPPVARLASSAASVLLLGLSVGPWTAHTAAEAREVQQKNQGTDYAYYQAIQVARTLPGRIAFEHRSSIALALFGEPDHGRAVFPETHVGAETEAEQWKLLQQWQVRYVVLRGSESPLFPALADATSNRFQTFQTFAYPEQRGKTSRAVIYQIHP